MRVNSSSAAQSSSPAAVESAVVRFQAFVFEHRNELAALPVLLAFLATRSMSGGWSLVAAALLMGIGAALRAWCTLYNRFAQGERKTFATAGPYAWLRNPLYVGNALVLAGCAVASGPAWLLPATVAWAFLVYDQVVRHEERRLLQKYGPDYLGYRARVGRWLPRLPLAPFGQRLPGFSRALWVQSRALLLLLLFAAKAGVLAVWFAA
jgi:protein-S-isoprenylcysteine O-methyltransferase Ste14